MNLLTASIECENDQLQVRAGSILLRIPSASLVSRPRLREYVNTKVGLGLRPKDIEDASLLRDRQSHHLMTVRIDTVESLGSERIVYFKLDAPPITTGGALDDLDEETRARMLEQSSTRLAGRFDPESRIVANTDARIAIDMRHAHFFDLDDGLSIGE